MKINAFQEQIPDIDKVLLDPIVRAYIQRTLTSVIGSLAQDDTQTLASRVLGVATSTPQKAYEQRANELLAGAGVTGATISQALSGRAETIYQQVKQYVLPGSMLDLGCGDGKVGERFAQDGLEIILADVYKNANVDKTGLEFIQFSQDERVPTERQFDNTLLLTVLHHCDDPVAVLQDARRLTKPDGRVAIIESVYGIPPAAVEPQYGGASDAITKDFKLLTQEQQRLAGVFFDHFYNRVIHYSADEKTKVNVPFNFQTPQAWSRLFAKLGFEPIATQLLGIDQPTVPEYHTLSIIEVPK